MFYHLLIIGIILINQTLSFAKLNNFFIVWEKLIIKYFRIFNGSYFVQILKAISWFPLTLVISTYKIKWELFCMFFYFGIIILSTFDMWYKILWLDSFFPKFIHFVKYSISSKEYIFNYVCKSNYRAARRIKKRRLQIRSESPC